MKQLQIYDENKDKKWYFCYLLKRTAVNSYLELSKKKCILNVVYVVTRREITACTIKLVLNTVNFMKIFLDLIKALVVVAKHAIEF
jgi:hypothetical protein